MSTGGRKVRQPVFDEPDRILGDLERFATSAEEIATSDLVGSTVEDAFLKALQLEFYPLHPAFEVLFHLLREFAPFSPGDEYARHISGFIHEFRKHGVTPAIELIGMLLERMWQNNRHLAQKYGRINELTGLLPICASCKKIRDDGGYWNQLEAYFASHSDARFTHGLCPDCATALYPEEFITPSGGGAGSSGEGFEG